jgi:recombination protein RecA
MDAPVKAPTPVNSEKAKALQVALAQIEKQFGKGTIMRLGEGEVIEDIQVVSTGSLGLDIAWAWAACRVAGWSKSTARSRPAKPR